MRKKRILFCSEFSVLNTGFSKMGRETIARIARTGNYEIAELANFGHPADPKGKSLPWKYYGVMPDNENDPAYACKSTNAFGEWRYEDTLLDFKPDVVISWLDIWMTAHQATSPLRPYYNLVWTTTCDGEPQDEEWIDLLTKCDGVFTYTDWAGEVLRKQGGNKIKLLGRNSPGVDHNIFHPVANKQAYKNPTLSNDEMLIVGTVMRNQKRKLYPDLILAFKKFLEYASERDRALANRTYLYLHTGYPDVGWDIPRLIKESGIGHKILITYICRECKTCFPSLFKDARTQCPSCGKYSAGLTNVGHGVSEEALAQIYNIFDVYVQYSLSEGLGIPLTEAASCGTPVFYTDCTGMRDFTKTLCGFPIKVQRFFREAETHRFFGLPDEDDFAAKLFNFLCKPVDMRKKRGFDTRLACEKNYSWDKSAEKYMKYVDNIPYASWDQLTKLHKPKEIANNPEDNEKFVEDAIINILGDEKYLSSYMCAKMINDLNYSARMERQGGFQVTDLSFLGMRPQYKPYNRQDVVNELLEMANNKNYWEQVRMGHIQRPTPEFIKIANS